MLCSMFLHSTTPRSSTAHQHEHSTPICQLKAETSNHWFVNKRWNTTTEHDDYFCTVCIIAVSYTLRQQRIQAPIEILCQDNNACELKHYLNERAISDNFYSDVISGTQTFSRLYIYNGYSNVAYGDERSLSGYKTVESFISCLARSAVAVFKKIVFEFEVILLGSLNMPNKSNKRKLLDLLISDCKVGLLTSKYRFKPENEIDTFIEYLEHLYSKRYIVKRFKIPRSDHWSLSILPNLDENHFRGQLRVSRQQFQFILSKIVHDPVFHQKTSKQIATERQLAIFLYRSGHNGNGSSYCDLSQKFGVSDGGTILNITRRVIKAVLNLKNIFVSWPNEEHREELEELISSQLPGCVGFVDGTHIPLEEKPSVDFPDNYFSRKQRYGLHLQIVCDYNLKIRHYKVGRPASVHDARVYSECCIANNPARYFSRGQYLGGDAAYKLTEFCITPFRKNATLGTSTQRKKFNRHFSKYRVKIEHTIGILKEKFCCLKELRVRISDNATHKYACQWIEACCVLYNMTVSDKDLLYYNLLERGEIYDEDICNDIENINGERMRQRLFDYVMNNC